MLTEVTLTFQFSGVLRRMYFSRNLSMFLRNVNNFRSLVTFLPNVGNFIPNARSQGDSKL
jgi:hypothetical protein